MRQELSSLRLRMTWGHKSPSGTPFHVRFETRGTELSISDARPITFTTVFVPDKVSLDRSGSTGTWRAVSGGGIVGGVEFILHFSRMELPRRQEQEIWTTLLEQTDPDAASRLRRDPAFVTDPPLLTVFLNPDGTAGFSLSLDQLLENRAFRLPELDIFLAVGEPFLSFEGHAESIKPYRGRRILDSVVSEPEATYDQFAAVWPDMGDPANDHPNHIAVIGWDSSIAKFGIDRLGGVRSDLGNLDPFRLDWELSGLAWAGQRLVDGLPVIVTTFRDDEVELEIEQFAAPMDPYPDERRGDIRMTLYQRLRLRNRSAETLRMTVRLTHWRYFPRNAIVSFTAVRDGNQTAVLEATEDRVLFLVNGVLSDVRMSIEAAPRTKEAGKVDGGREKALRLDVVLTARANRTREILVRLPSPTVDAGEIDSLAAKSHSAERRKVLRFWNGWLSRGAVFETPEKAVNEQFRAGLWHALRLPRRHGDDGVLPSIDLPYSNLAYGQEGAPWPVNQAVYVDTMLYDLRGYHAVSLEELLVLYRSNQEADGRVGGYANWGVYTPSMVYSSAMHFLLTGDRSSFDRLLPPTMKALDWCLNALHRSDEWSDQRQGLILAPLNDLSHEESAWAFNQAYFYAAFRTLGRALRRIGHPRALECETAAKRLREAIRNAFGKASAYSPAVELRDHTWIPYVPCDAFTPRRRIEEWYPTDVDTGALHLTRLGAIGPRDPLTTYLLNDQEDNLFINGTGMANEPVYNQQATAYLLRDEPEAVIRSFYSMTCCGFSRTVREPVEHRWGWGQYFGPPSTDGAWFDLYRRMLLQERDDGTLLLLWSIPRAWLADGRKIRIRSAPTEYGPISLSVDSHLKDGWLAVRMDPPRRIIPASISLRLRLPDRHAIQSVTVNRRAWSRFDGDTIQFNEPNPRRYSVIIQTMATP